jgi:hypothetical protein
VWITLPAIGSTSTFDKSTDGLIYFRDTLWISIWINI